MKVLVIGAGGREHALAWKLAQSSRVERVYVAPGNGGTAQAEHVRNVPITDLRQLADWAVGEKIGLTVLGPEAPLADGVVDLFRDRKLRVFGPTRAAAQLESSKAFSKAFMQRHGIPTAAFATFTERSLAHAFVKAQGAPIVVKADGLAAGKGFLNALPAASENHLLTCPPPKSAKIPLPSPKNLLSKNRFAICCISNATPTAKTRKS